MGRGYDASVAVGLEEADTQQEGAMRELAALLAVVFSLIVVPTARAGAPDGIGLTAARGPAAGQVTLSWNGTIPSYTVYRSSDAATVTNLGNSLGNTSANSFADTPPVGLSFYLVVGNCPAGQVACAGLCDADTDADTYCDRQDYCATDPQKVDRGQCGCFEAENTGDTDGDGVINCHDQCLGNNDAIDTDRGGLPDACDPCPTGACPLTLPDRFYAELPNHQAVRVSRDGRWIGAIDRLANRGFLIPTDQLVANPLDTSYYVPLGSEVVTNIRAISDDGNIVLADISTNVPQSASEVLTSAIYDRTNGSWRVLGLYNDAVDVDACHFYSHAADMTSDGKVIFGTTPTVANACRLAGFRHVVEAGTWQLFTGPAGRVQHIEGASGDGTRIVGSEQDASIGERGVIWTDQPPGSFSPLTMPQIGEVYDVTFDGSAASVSSDTFAHRWTAASGLQQLGAGKLDPEWSAKAAAIADGGNIIVGYHVLLGANSLPFIWVEGVGFGNLRSYLVFRGHTQLGGFDNSYIALDISGDGRVIVGRDAGAFSGLPGWVVITRHQ
jgi:uncharacterized membrane protein